MQHENLDWTVPLMRAGFVGRGLFYLVVAGFSLFAILRGGQAQGGSSALAQLENEAWGSVLLVLIFFGALAYAFWRALDALYDLDAKGTGMSGLAARAAMIVSAAVYAGVAFLAFSLLAAGGDNSSGQGSTAAQWVAALMEWPGGRWVVGLAGAAVMAGGFAIVAKAWKQGYRRYIVANHFTLRWNWALRAGLAAHGVVIATVGLLLVVAAWRFDPQAAGGSGEALQWLTRQPYGRTLVTALCIGLLGFALYCFVSAGWRVMPRVSGSRTGTLLTPAPGRA